MQAATADASLTLEAAVAALDLGTLPVVVCGPRARMVHANRAARALLDAKRTFHDTAGRLTVNRSPDQDQIEAAIAATIGAADRSIVRLSNRQGDIHHVLVVSPLPGGALCAITVAELRAPLLLGRNWSRDALQLPSAYAELAEAMVMGENLSEFAERTGLTIGGSRTRLKKLLRRLAARSQADLVSLLLRASASLSIR